MHRLKALFVQALIFLAKKRLPKNIPIAGITGSVGKTTAKDALAHILKMNGKQILASKKSMNSDTGLPLTLLELESPADRLGWLVVLVKAFWQSKTPIRAEQIVLEYGVDAPGDMARLLGVTPAQLGIFTATAASHMADGQFESAEQIAAEEGGLIRALPGEEAGGIAVLNADDPAVLATPTAARRVTFGLVEPADVVASEITEDLNGLAAAVTAGQTTARLRLPFIGRQNLYPILAAIAAARELGVPLAACVRALADFRLPAGRGNFFQGLGGSRLIDSTYNSSPAATLASLDSLAELAVPGRKIAVLGQMNELGSGSGKWHERIGRRAGEVADEVIAVFGDAGLIAAEAAKLGKSTKFFETAEQAAEYLIGKLQPGDLVLLKGSQNKVRLEKAVARLLADPARDRKFLCRQEPFWQRN